MRKLYNFCLKRIDQGEVMVGALIILAVSIVMVFVLNIAISGFTLLFAVESELVHILLGLILLPLAPFLMGSMALIVEQMWILCGVYRLFGVRDLPVRRAVRRYALKG